jgi:DNA repair protein RadC
VCERAASDRPRERLLASGASSLSDAELLALLLRTGSSREGVLDLAARILAQLGGAAGLARAGTERLAQIPGCGPAKVTEIVAALELGRRCARALAAERPQISGPEDAVALLEPQLAHLDHERSVALLLDRKHRLLREAIVGIGGVSHSPMEAREIFAVALREPGTAAILVAHNHPSGDPEPSPEDVAVTRRLVEAGELVGIDLLDHVVVAARGWASIRHDVLGDYAMEDGAMVSDLAERARRVAGRLHQAPVAPLSRPPWPASRQTTIGGVRTRTADGADSSVTGPGSRTPMRSS